jgi:cation:H+ antiporter
MGVSLFAWAVLLVYIYGLRLIYLEGNDPSVKSIVSEERRPFDMTKFKSLTLPLLGYSISAFVILAAAPYLVHAADQLAKQSGMGHTFIGTTLVAMATSLPELVATLAAFRLGSPDLALGNIFGSNAFNMILIIPLDFMYPKALFSNVRSLHAVTALSIVVATGVAVMGQLYRKKERSRITEPSSEIVVVVILLFLFLLFWLKPL